jgi:putative PEP-CTERM system TPR-repeat lipoprotein
MPLIMMSFQRAMKNQRFLNLIVRCSSGCLRLFGAVFLSVILLAPAYATPEKAARFYEDALGKFEKNDMPGAVIQLKNALQQDQKMLAAHLLLGKALLRDGDLKGAEAAFEEALRQGVNRGEVALPLGQVYLALGRPEAVIERIAVTGLPSALQVEVLTMRGNAYVESGNARLASQSFDEARALDPKSASPLIAEIPMLLTAGQLDRAKERAGKALELAPNNAYAWTMKASVLHASFDMTGALTAYDRALTLAPAHVDARIARAALLIDLKREVDARKDLDFLRASGSDDPRAAYLRAVLAGQLSDGPAIAAALAEVTRIIDALPPPWLARREQLLMTGALAHHGLGNHQKAREYLDIIISRNSRNLGAKKLLASIYVDAKDYGRALPLLEALQKITPDDPQVMFLLGSVHMAQRRYVQATELLEKAAARTGSSEMNRTLAFSQLGLGRNELGQASLEKAFAANPADTKAGTALAMLYMRQGKAQKALQTAEAMLKREPANLTALNFLGSIKGASGDSAGARAAYTQALAKDPAFIPSALNLVRLDVNEKRFDEARRRLDGMLVKHHDDSDVLFEYGMLEQRAGRMGEAIRHLQKASEVQRRDARPALALIDLHLGQRQADQALNVAKMLASKTPDNLSVQLALARTYLAAGDAGNARSVLTGATRLAEYDAATQLAIARMQILAGNPDGAAYSVQKALQGLPDDPASLALMVEIEARRGDAAKADAALRTLSGKHPNRVETALATANLAMSRGQYVAAVAAYRAALSREESADNVLLLARAHLAAGEPSKAAVFLEGWVKTRPNDISALKALAESQFRAGQLPAARQSYLRVITAEPDDASALNNYANLLLQLNDPAAQAQAEKALKLSPSNPFYADTLGWILIQKGQLETGLRHLREARLRSPESGEIRFHLAYALAKNGRKAEAKEELSAALNGPGRVANSESVNQLKKELGL